MNYQNKMFQNYLLDSLLDFFTCQGVINVSQGVDSARLHVPTFNALHPDIRSLMYSKTPSGNNKAVANTSKLSLVL